MATQTFQRESAKAVLSEITPLLEKHWDEIAHFRDIPLNPDYETYFKMDDAGLLRVFTARDEATKELIGYAIFFIKHNLHYKDSLQALQDVLFVDPTRRGSFSPRFVLWCDRQLKAEGVQVVFQHVKCATWNTIEFFQKLGYEKIDLILGKRLDKGEI